MVFRGKRAEGMIPFIYSFLFSLLLAAFFIIAIFMRVKAASEDSSFHKRFFSRDLAMTVDSLHAANGEMIILYDIRYPESMSLETMLESDRISLTDADKITLGKKTPTSFLFGKNERIEIVPSTIGKDADSFKVILKDESIEFSTDNWSNTDSVAEATPEK